MILDDDDGLALGTDRSYSPQGVRESRHGNHSQDGGLAPLQSLLLGQHDGARCRRGVLAPLGVGGGCSRGELLPAPRLDGVGAARVRRPAEGVEGEAEGGGQAQREDEVHRVRGDHEV